MVLLHFYLIISGFAFYITKQSAIYCWTRALLQPQTGKSPPEHWHPWGDPLGNVKPKTAEGAQFAKYATFCEHSTRQGSLRKTLNRFLKEGWKKILNEFWRLRSQGGRGPSWIPRAPSRCLSENARSSGGSSQNEPSWSSTTPHHWGWRHWSLQQW